MGVKREGTGVVEGVGVGGVGWGELDLLDHGGPGASLRALLEGVAEGREGGREGRRRRGRERELRGGGGGGG